MSEPKLANTALTRAKSYVAVIGDPVALCNVGECSAIWRHYIKHCRKVGSVFPSTLTGEHFDIQYQCLTYEGSSSSCCQQPDEIIQELGNVNTSQSLFDFIEEEDDVAYVKPGANVRLSAPPDDIIDSKLQELIHGNPKEYKICVLHVVRAEFAYAVPKSEVQCRRICVEGRHNRGRAYGGDEVFVKILPKISNNEANGRTFGRVVGIHRRAVNLQNRHFVCHPPAKACGIMIPLNTGAPIMKCLIREQDRESIRKNFVCVYGKAGNQRSFFKIDTSNPHPQLFKVRYVCWRKDCDIPLGEVVGLIPNSKVHDFTPNVTSALSDDRKESELERAMEVLRASYEIEDDASEDDDLSNNELRNTTWPEGENCCDKIVFTIDHRNSVDLDDALGVERLGSDHLVIGIYIADVSSGIPVGSAADRIARSLGCTLFKVGRDGGHRPMIRSKNYRNKCSLLADGIERHTISVCITINAASYEVVNVKIKRCRVRVRCNLTYREADDMIRENNTWPDDAELLDSVPKRLHILSAVAQSWRCRREAGAIVVNATSRELIAEMMIAANHRVAEKLVEVFPILTPLRRQRILSDDELKNWRECHLPSILSFHKCSATFSRHVTIMEDVLPSGMVDISRTVWFALLDAVARQDVVRMSSLVFSTRCSPKVTLASAELHRNYQNTAEYVRHNADESSESWRHESLNLPLYLHFTSPLRRYMDLVVHRLVTSFIQRENIAGPYTEDEIDVICTECNCLANKASECRRDKRGIYIGVELARRPLVLNAIISKMSDESLSFFLPIFRSVLELRMAVLQPCEAPQFNQDNKCFKIKWQQRIYDHKASKGEVQRSCQSRFITLQPDEYIVCVSASGWKEVMNTLQANNVEAAVAAVRELSPLPMTLKNVENLTSESRVAAKLDHFCRYSMMLKMGSVVKVQLCGDLRDIFPKPCIQLLYLTGTEVVCVQHVDDSVKCFTQQTSTRATKDEYKDITHYQQLWFPVLAMEAAFSAVVNEYSAIIHRVHIKWESDRQTGSFDLQREFCEKRGINFLLRDDTIHNYTNNGYICVRYQNMQCTVRHNGDKTDFSDDDDYDDDDDDDDIFSYDCRSSMAEFRRTAESNTAFTWVGHCQVSHVSMTKNEKCYHVVVRLNEHNCEFPTKLLQNSQKQQPEATIEWMEKTLPDKYNVI